MAKSSVDIGELRKDLEALRKDVGSLLASGKHAASKGKRIALDGAGRTRRLFRRKSITPARLARSYARRKPLSAVLVALGIGAVLSVVAASR